MIYVGIDPGKNGGLAILQWEEVQTFRYDRDTCGGSDETN
jgi:hypothetical protein